MSELSDFLSQAKARMGKGGWILIQNGGGILAVPYCDRDQTSEEWEASVERRFQELGPEGLQRPECESEETREIIRDDNIADNNRGKNQER